MLRLGVSWGLGLALCAGMGCSDSETTSAATGGAGGSAGPSCERSDECVPEACEAGEAASTSCNDGTCETRCDTGYVACSGCADASECTFTGDLCPPPNTNPFQSCFDGKCSEFCGAASEILCLTDAECPQVQCPGSAAPVAQCLGGGCVDAAVRCCTG